MAIEIHKVGVRNALDPQREPYWGAPIRAGRYLGVRKLIDGTCRWIARARDDEGKQHYRALGQATRQFDYNAAKNAAEAWFKDFDVGVNTDPRTTVAHACKEYVKELRAEGRESTAADTEIRFKATIYEHTIAKAPLAKLRTKTIRDWRDGLNGGKATQNRNLTALKAALNRAVQNRRVNAAMAQEWRAVKPHRNADGRRELFLDLTQRRALLAACTGTLRDLVEAAMLTGARPGELVRLKRSDFEARTATLKITGKTGTRVVPLSDAALKFFRSAARGKLPTAPLLPRDDGQHWNRNGKRGWTKMFSEAVSAAELPAGTVLYTLRHSWITEALRSGMSTLDVARLTGTSLQMIEKHYGHLVADSARERLAGVTML